MPGAGIIRNTGIIRGRALYEEIRYYTYGNLDFFFSPAQTAKNSPELKIHIKNLAKDTFVYYLHLRF